MRNKIKVSLSVSLFIFLPGIRAQDDTLRLLFAGDIMGHLPQIESAALGEGEGYNYRPCFEEIRTVLESVDLAVGNLELTLPGSPPYTGYPMFRSPDALADALKWAGFDVMVTANNHSNDSRGSGVIRTLSTLRAYGFMQTGTFKDWQDRLAFQPLLIEERGIKLAILNYTYGTNGVPTESPTIVNLLDTALMGRDLRAARLLNPDFVIVIVHWGLEYQLVENEQQRRVAKFLISQGADLIVGSHPHVVQPIKTETVRMADGSNRSAVVVYSLGNFISNQKQPNTEGGIIFRADLAMSGRDGKVRLVESGYIPIYRDIRREVGLKPVYRVIPISYAERFPERVSGLTEASWISMGRFVSGLRSRLSHPEIKLGGNQ
jgi:poly-gamma-glutamate synthesis protein (capsule biosynthesis protein)